MNINCQFCYKCTHYKPLKAMKDLGVDVYFCFACNAEYLVWQNSNIGSVSLYTTINEKMYRWTVAGDRHTLWYVENPGVPGFETNKNLKHILSIDENSTKPVMTPNNIQEKIRTYLLIL